MNQEDWRSQIDDSWDDWYPGFLGELANYLELHRCDDQPTKTIKYLDPATATPEQLQPKVRLYARTETATYVARIGMADDWAVYTGHPMSSYDEVADYGNKMREEEAVKIFPICYEAGLTYRH